MEDSSDAPTALDLLGRSGTEDTVSVGAPDTPPTNKVRATSVADHVELVFVDREHYAIGPEIARGGMGRIHAARDRRLGREVAIKELLTDSPGLARRFEREARITARLQHPSIVSVHEAGRWPSGEPFYVMKLVSGRSLYEAIQATTTFAERIALVPNVLAVADAMAYAHSQRVIHRDLKPGNVIVGEFGETVVIDWGIAKSVDDPDMPATPLAAPGDVGDQTVAGLVLGTPGYMAPEQAAGEAVDERADVFAIGVILYHTLTGRAPFRGSQVEIAEAMASGVPRVAELVPSIPADLSAIVERAMATDLGVRYRDARELADDLRRFQTGQLVGAHHYSTLQLVRRWLRRHRTAVAVAAIAAVVLATVGGLSLRSVFREREIAQAERVHAEKRGADAEDSMGFMLFDLADKLRQAGRIELMDTVVRRAVDYYDHTTDADIDPTRLVAALAVIGDVLRAEGDLTAALRQYQRAETIAKAHAGDGAIWRHHLATAYNNIGETVYAQGDLAGAIAYHRKSLSLAEALVAEDPNDRRWQRDLAVSQRLAAGVLEDQGDVDGALAYLQASFAIRKRLAEQHLDRDTQHDLVAGHADIGMALAHRRDAAGAMIELRAAQDLAERAAAADPHATIWQRDVAVAHERIGELLLARGDLAGALVELRRDLDVMTRLATLDTANADWQRRLAIAHEHVGSALLQLGDVGDALPELLASQAIRVKLTARDPTNARWHRDLSHATNRLGDALLASGDVPGALAAYREATRLREQLVAKDASSVKWQADVFSSRRRIGNALLASGDSVAALTELDAAAELAKTVLARDPGSIDDADLVELHDKLADAALARGDRARAKRELEVALAIAKRGATAEPDDPRRPRTVARLEAKLART